jgi:penicillin amidase
VVAATTLTRQVPFAVFATFAVFAIKMNQQVCEGILLTKAAYFAVFAIKILSESLMKIIRNLFVFLFVVLLLLSVAVYLLLKGSLPMREGEIQIVHLKHPVAIMWDEKGIPTISAANRIEAAFGMGFLHAQERFFQMDLMRRAASGELSEIFGSATLDFDKERRLHQFRKISKKTWNLLSEEEKQLLETYTLGVNEGLKALSVRPFEYLLLGSAPEPWRSEDSILSGFSLFFELQDPLGNSDLVRKCMERTLPQTVYRFFAENGSIWDASLDSSKLPIITIPESNDFSYINDHEIFPSKATVPSMRLGGSNQWALMGSKTSDGRALLACDMHLNLSVPNVWYRTSLQYRDINARPIEVHGASLPGTPLIAIGTNSHIAWGFTNSYINTSQILLIDRNNPKFQFISEREIIKIKGAESYSLDIIKTEWGPLLPKKFFNQSALLLWVAHNPQALNMRLPDLEEAFSVKEALEKS